jgi:hypothetical protein
MPPLATLIIAIVTLLLTILAAIARQGDNTEIRKILSWVLSIFFTLLLPNFTIIWLTMQIAAQIIAPSVVDLSSFTSRVAWWTASIGMIYPVIWGIWLQPKIAVYIQEKILVVPKPQGESGRNTSSKKQGEKSK